MSERDRAPAAPRWRDPRAEPPAVRRALIVAAVAFLALFLLLPLLVVFVRALEKGTAAYLAAIDEPYARAAALLTLRTAALVVPANLLFGLAAAWAVTRFEFRGKNLLVTLVDAPFTVSPVVAGLLFVLLFGAQGLFGPWLLARGVKILFSWPAIALVTAFVTMPLVARQLIPLMQAQGSDEEQAALTLGASPWRMFFRVALPKVRWGLLYGVLLCNARAMGEFGAVSVVSGHIRGSTNTLPLHVEILYDEYQFQAAFAVATLLALLGLLTLAAQALLDWRLRRRGGA
ncbi:MAG TPA: sulfate ABC transporter permease subunit CysW [Thermoanaerobaculia bacterium]|nr:sulfate ABC transporter permease subunit CysW [Thermoanaerobaculia bacterium]